MFGQKKKKKSEIKDLPPMPPKPTETEEVKILQQSKADLMTWVLNEFSENYSGVFKSEDLDQIDTEATSLNLLVAIFAELRMIREIQQKAKK